MQAMERDEIIRFVISLIRMVSLLFIAMLVWHIWLSNVVLYQQANNDELAAFVTKKKVEVALFEKRQKHLVEMIEHLRFISDLREQNAKTAQLLDAINEATPVTVKLYQMSYQGKQMLIDGFTGSDLELIQFINNIRRSSVLMQPIIERLKTVGEIRYFQLKTTVKS